MKSVGLNGYNGYVATKRIIIYRNIQACIATYVVKQLVPPYKLLLYRRFVTMKKRFVNLITWTWFAEAANANILSLTDVNY